MQGGALQAGMEEGVPYPTLVPVKHQLEALMLQVESILLNLEGLSSNQRQAWWPAVLKHTGLESCSYVVAKPWSHPRSCGSPELVEIIIKCPVLS